MKIILVDKDGHSQDAGLLSFLDTTVHHIHQYNNTTELFKLTSQTPDLIIIDCSFFLGQEDKLVNSLNLYFNSSIILILCQQDDIQLAHELAATGFYGFILRDKYLTTRLKIDLNNINKLLACRSDLTNLQKLLIRKYDLSGFIIGESKGIRKVTELVHKAINLQSLPVAVFGEPGTGKELVARAIHFNSGRKEYPFIPLNLGAIPNEFMESELYGHERGSTAGSFSRVLGKIEEAQGGTIYINDVADLDNRLQYKLLRAIQDRVIRRAGGTRDIPVDTRIIVSTSKDLSEEVKNGKFREDLYYNLLRLTIFIPPLSERGNDIINLANHFIKSYCLENKLEKKEFTAAARRKLLAHNYPGNVRELNSVVELAAVLSHEPVIDEEHILFASSHSGTDIFNEDLSLKEFEIRIIRNYLDRYNNNVVMVAKKLGIGKSKIYNMIRKGEL